MDLFLLLLSLVFAHILLINKSNFIVPIFILFLLKSENCLEFFHGVFFIVNELKSPWKLPEITITIVIMIY